jgi:hypothetical protein
LGQQIPHGGQGLFLGLDLTVPLHGPQGGHGPAFAIHIPAKLKVVSQNEVRKGFPIAFKLGAFFLCVQVYPYVLGFHIPQEHRPTVNRYIGFAALGNLPGFIGGREAFPQGFQEGLEGGPVRML